MEFICCFACKRISTPVILGTLVGVGGGEGIPLGILGGSVPSCSPNPDPISDQKMSFFTPVFQTKPLKSIPIFRPEILCHDYLDSSTNKKFRQMHFEFSCFWFFLIHLELTG